MGGEPAHAAQRGDPVPDLQVPDALADGPHRTAPENSDPGTKGRGGLNWHLPSTMRRSEKLRLAALLKACEGLGHIDVIAPEQNASRC